MAEEYRTEEEQVEALKKWWRENGKSTVISVVVGVSLVIGWQGWQKQQKANVEAASAVYQNLLNVVGTNQGELNDEQVSTANHLADTLIKDFPDSTYSRFAAFSKARFAVKAKDLDAAEKELRWVLDSGTTPELVLQANLRLARVLYAKDQLDDALAALTGDAAGYASAYEELKGDIYRAKGDVSQARLAYQKAQDLNQQAQSPVNNPLLDLKIQQLDGQQGA